MEKAGKEWYVPNPAIYIRTLVHIFIPFGLHSVTDVESRPPDDDVVGN